MITFTEVFRPFVQSFADAHRGWCYKLNTHDDFSLQNLSSWGWMENTTVPLFHVSTDMFNGGVAEPLKDVHRLVLKPLLFHLGCAFRVIVVLEAEPLLQSEVLSALEQVFLLKDVSVLWSVLIFFPDPDKSLSACCLKTSGDERDPISSRCSTWHSEPNLGLTIWPQNHGPNPF